MQIFKIIKLNGTLCFGANQGAMATFLGVSGIVKIQNAALKTHFLDPPTACQADQPENAAASRLPRPANQPTSQKMSLPASTSGVKSLTLTSLSTANVPKALLKCIYGTVSDDVGTASLFPFKTFFKGFLSLFTKACFKGFLSFVKAFPNGPLSFLKAFCWRAPILEGSIAPTSHRDPLLKCVYGNTASHDELTQKEPHWNSVYGSTVRDEVWANQSSRCHRGQMLQCLMTHAGFKLGWSGNFCEKIFDSLSRSRAKRSTGLWRHCDCWKLQCPMPLGACIFGFHSILGLLQYCNWCRMDPITDPACLPEGFNASCQWGFLSTGRFRVKVDWKPYLVNWIWVLTLV